MLFNGISKGYISILKGRVRPFFSPLIRDSKFDSNLIKTDRGHRVIQVPIWISYKDLNEFRDLTEDISGWLVHDEPKILEFEDEPDRFYWAVVDNTINEDELYNNGTEAIVTFVCGYKYAHDKKADVNLTKNKLIEGHKSTMWRSLTKFTSTQSSYTIEFSSPNKTDLRDINKIKLSYEFIKGDVLRIDYSKRLVTVNDNDISNAVVILQSNFKELPIGNVSFSSSHKTEITYNERYY